VVRFSDVKAKLFLRDSSEPLCEVELEIRGDPTYGAPYEAKLAEADVHVIGEVQGGVVFEAADRVQYEGAVQHAFRTPRGGALLQGPLRQRKGKPVGGPR
jgi:hypothetical protein